MGKVVGTEIDAVDDEEVKLKVDEDATVAQVEGCVAPEHVGVRTTNGDTKTEEYTKMNPLQKVPVIKDGDFVLTESVAMFRYLAREKNVADHWYPSDSKAQARVDEYLEWQHLNT